MKLIEQFICGKKDDPALCEDMIVITPDFVAVIDGATSKSCPEMAGKSGGRFAAETVAQALEKLPADMHGKEAMRQLSGILLAATKAHMPVTNKVEKPSCSLAIYSRIRREVWRVGDIGILLDGIAYMAVKEIDDVTSRARALMIETLLAQGKTVEALRENDAGRDFIFPLLQQQHLFANRADDCVFGYGVMNGDDIPEKYIDILPVDDAGDIVMASDGYPVLQTTHAETEKALQDILRDDPLLYKDYPSTKGLQKDQVSFDDRSYLRFTI